MRSHVPETDWMPVDANGLTFACLTWGEGPLVLLVHGFPDTAHTWDAIGPRIAARGYRVVAPFTRGYAPTTIPEGEVFSPDHQASDLIGLLEALTDEPAIVVGHDWGAVATYAAAHKAPERLRKLITVGIPHPLTVRLRPSLLWGARHLLTHRLPGAAARWQADSLGSLRTLYERWSPSHTWSDDDLAAVANAFAAPGCLHAALGYYRCLPIRQPAYMKRPIPVPSLVLGGLHDGVLTTADFERSAGRFAPGQCTVQMIPGGHFPHLEHPEPFFEALAAFIGSASA